MSEWYVSQVKVREGDKSIGEPGLVCEEKVLTIKLEQRLVVTLEIYMISSYMYQKK